MGIYIPDMEMPKDGDFELWIAIKKDGSFTYNIRGKWKNGKQKVNHVPDHGRLVDADAVKDIVQAHDYPLRGGINSVDNGMWTIGIFQAIDEAPTIIPADIP